MRIIVGAHPRTPCRNLFKKLDILPVPCQYTFSLMNFFVNNQENFQTNSSVHSIIQGISTIFVDQLPTYHAFRKVHSILVSEFSIVYYSVTNLKNEKAQIKVALRRYLNAHCFYPVDEFLTCTDKL
jgi:hypothetical protein